MGNDGIFVSEVAPDAAGKITWLKILPDGGREWYEHIDGSWELVASEDAPAFPTSIEAAIAAHAAKATAHHPIPDGLTGTRVIDGHTLTFTAGILTGYEAP